ncbi:MAG: HAD family phosphatase [Anaerolineae bacterium]|nr:HAD family phosphatase [Anaerolineae bacterium]
MAIKAVVFDMDGVLIESETYWLKSRQEFAAAMGKEWTDADHRLAMGRNTIEWAQLMKERLEPDMNLDEIMADIKARMMAHYEEHMPLRPYALEAVTNIAREYRVGLASGSPTELIKHILRLTGLDQVFEVVVYGDDMPNGKPAPDSYLHALKLMNLAPEEAAGIEDSSNGVRALVNAGMYAVGAPVPEFPLPPDVAALCDRIIPTLDLFTPELVRSLENTPRRGAALAAKG